MRSKTGFVVTAKDKTIVVRVDSYRTHAKYKKRYRVSNKFHAHDPENTHKIGDKVTIYESRPLSKLKRWTIVKPSNEPTQ
ncbi:30S ribosomal protein S17 [Candidatus Peregrinibacteria bacterium]|jgi:small subunit ribosomal protein S17|nr:30S ribosomal protein S17 [Candidatus Peregrinibacteria bacterium]MBT7484431.1 30S ribosomal protein S17 [Candidatus Peregrinibacteria bacterium]MBT7703696.1 30S ribosomal protein S17 [Candidatus Peregrinibacteria bacterium]